MIMIGERMLHSRRRKAMGERSDGDQTETSLVQKRGRPMTSNLRERVTGIGGSLLNTASEWAKMADTYNLC
jgi:hypothetical protein